MPSNSTSAIPPATVAHAISGHVALDFCNTAGEHLAAPPAELMGAWELFARWALQVGLLDPVSYAALVRQPAPVEPILRLRETIFRCGLALARGHGVPPADLATLQRQARAAKPPVVATREGRLRWRPDPERASSQLRALLAGEALSLFCSDRAPRIGVCAGGACGWLFLDESRGKKRRWCDMKDCGNRAKARRHYQGKTAGANRSEGSTSSPEPGTRNDLGHLEHKERP